MITYRSNFLILWNCSVIDKSMIVQEQSTCYVESDEHVNTVMFMGSKNEKDSKTVTKPRKSVEEEDSSGSVFSYEEIEESEWHSVSWKHVITACPNTLQLKIVNVLIWNNSF